MLLERTLSQLDIGAVPHDRAAELGQLGYMQWLGALPPRVSYPREVERAFNLAMPFARTSPAVRVFCDLLIASTRMPLEPLRLTLPDRHRRGGAKARRAAF